jgi:ABC-type nitrate/sulfonate/bicarbonate transport system ATPase subunit
VASTLTLKNLRVALPDGRVLIDGLDLEMAAGEVIVLLGGSGAGKSTLARVLFERDELDAAGFAVTADTLEVDRNQLGLVPQRGALFDHLDIKGNIELAQRYSASEASVPQDAAAWLRSVGLDAALAQTGKSVTQLSGGPARRGSAGPGI